MANEYTVHLGTMQYAVGDWPGENGVIVGVNGILGNRDMLLSLGNALAPEFRFISYDLRGRGDSSAGEASSLELHAADLLGLLDYLGIESAVLLGHSMGAYIAAIAATQSKKVKGAVFLDGGGVMGEAQKANIEPIFDRIGRPFPSEEAYLAAYRAVYLAKGMAWTPNLAAYVQHDLGEIAPGLYRHKGNPERIREDYESLLAFQPAQVYPSVPCPVLVVHAAGRPGDTDVLYPNPADLFGVTRQYLQDRELIASDRDHLTLVLEEDQALLQSIRTFAYRCLGLERS